MALSTTLPFYVGTSAVGKIAQIQTLMSNFTRKTPAYEYNYVHKVCLFSQ